MPYYLNPNLSGIISAHSDFNGTAITLNWSKAYPLTPSNKVAYNIYFNDGPNPDFTIDHFSSPPIFVCIDGYTSATIDDLIPGTMYHFAVRAFEYTNNTFDFTTLPIVYNNLRVMPKSLLSEDISSIDMLIPLVDADGFPSSGIIKLGTELIEYSSITTNNLVVSGDYSNSQASSVNLIDGSLFKRADGYVSNGYIYNLSLIKNDAPTANWTIQCITGNIINDHIIPGEARFIAIPGILGAGIANGVFGDGYYDGYYKDGYGFDSIVWKSNGIIRSNGVLGFSIFDGFGFEPGDYLNLRVSGTITSDTLNGRGFDSTVARSHSIDGYDGKSTWEPNALFWIPVNEEQNTKVFECQARFDTNKQKYLTTDGYHQKTADLLNTDMTVSDEINKDFPSYDFNAYHTDPKLVLSGQCIGSYIGGVRGCINGESGSFIIRGVSPVVQNQQRQEVLLSVSGEPVILVKRSWTGSTCTCYIQSQEYPESRCSKCLGTGFIVGWQQFFNPKRSDRKIMVRFDPAVETVEPTESGLESKLPTTNWTMNFPTIHSRDFIVRFDQAGNEEFRYEVINVTRNKFILDSTGLQKFSLQRIRRTDPIYMVPIYENVNTNTDGSSGINTFRTLYTSIESSDGFPPHLHSIQVSNSVISPTQVNGITSIAMGHSHLVERSVIKDGSEVPGESGIGHKHTLIFT